MKKLILSMTALTITGCVAYPDGRVYVPPPTIYLGYEYREPCCYWYSYPQPFRYRGEWEHVEHDRQERREERREEHRDEHGDRR